MSTIPQNLSVLFPKVKINSTFKIIKFLLNFEFNYEEFSIQKSEVNKNSFSGGDLLVMKERTSKLNTWFITRG